MQTLSQINEDLQQDPRRDLSWDKDDDHGQIYALLAKVAEECGAVGKTGYNISQKYNYRTAEDILNTVHGAFAKNGVVLIPTVLERVRDEIVNDRTDNRGDPYKSRLFFTHLKVKFRFYAPDGSCIDSVVWGEAMDSGDKGTNKAMTAALKYCLSQVLLLPFDVIDSEIDSHQQTSVVDLPPKQAPRRRSAGVTVNTSSTVAAGASVQPGADEELMKDPARFKGMFVQALAKRGFTIDGAQKLVEMSIEKRKFKSVDDVPLDVRQDMVTKVTEGKYDHLLLKKGSEI